MNACDANGPYGVNGPLNINQLWSDAGNIVTYRRLMPQNIRMLLYLHENADLWDPSTVLSNSVLPEWFGLLERNM